MPDVDFIIIGSRFSRSSTACRLAAAGANVLVLERGREWTPTNFPRKPNDAWVWDDLNPGLNHGWWDIRMFPHMTVAQGAGVGGGSLVYANISVEAKPESFASGWPSEITADSLAPHYAEVGRMMEIQEVPKTQWPERTKLLNDAAQAAGWGDRFRQLGTAVRYDKTWTYDQPDPHNHAKSTVGNNIHGVEQGTCVHLGECDLGCPVRARNTLDFNYLAVARKNGAKVLPLHIVRSIKAIAGGGYELAVNEITGSKLTPKTLTAK